MQKETHQSRTMIEIHKTSKPPKKNKIKNKSNNTLTNMKRIKRPLTAYFSFCEKQREKFQNSSDNKRLTAKELSAMWKKLPENEKKKFYDQYEKEKEEYNKKKEELKKLEEEEEENNDKNKLYKVMAKVKRSEYFKKKYQECNCGECDDCKIRKKKKEEEEEEIEDNKLAKMKAKKVVDDDDDD